MVGKITNNILPSEANEGVAVIDFSATWCGPCQMIAPIVEQLSEEMAGKVKFYNADVDENGELAQQQNIMSVPSLLILKEGQKQELSVGFMPKQNLQASIEKYL